MPIITRIWLGAAVLAVVAAAWFAPIAVGMVIEPPLRVLVGWIGETGGAWGLAAFGLGLPMAFYLAAWRLNRRDTARRFAADRTIHVEQSRWTPAFKLRFALACCLPIGAVLLIAIEAWNR